MHAYDLQISTNDKESSYESSESKSEHTMRIPKKVKDRSTSSSESICEIPSTSCASVGKSIVNISDRMFTFQSLVSPLTNIITNYGKNSHCPTFTMYKNNNSVTLSWEPFSGKISESGVDGLVVTQGIKWLPGYPIEYPIIIYYKSNRELGAISITLGSNYQIKILLPRGVCVRTGDAICIPGSVISWLTN